MTKTAWLFPGQGSQAVGMGADLFDLPDAKARCDRAQEILGWSVPEICQGEEATLARTLYTQPCLYVLESILVDLLRSRGQAPDLVAGHSLGEYVALYAAGVFAFDTGLTLVKRRAELMDAGAEGVMAALMKFDRDRLDEAIAQTPDVVLANDNSPAQVVISGKPEAVDTVIQAIEAKRAIKLNVSGAFHSPLMAKAAEEFHQILAGVDFADAKVPVLSNVDPTPATDASTLKERLARQLTGQVRWREISLRLPEEGIQQAVEVGPGKVLKGLVERTCEVPVTTVNGAADIPG